jgi:hypothetical protein
VAANGESWRNAYTVVGVVADVHFGSIRREVEPVTYFFPENYSPGVMTIKLLANVVAWPLAYMVMNRWLENFAYRIDLTPIVFIGSGLIALCIAWVTLGGTAAKAASAKPILALRYQ